MSSEGWSIGQSFTWKRLPSPEPTSRIEEIPDDDVSWPADETTNAAASTSVSHSGAHGSPHLSVPTPSVSRTSRKRSISSLDEEEAESPSVHNGAGPSSVAAPGGIAPHLTLNSHSTPATSGALVRSIGGGSGPRPGSSTDGFAQGGSIPKLPFGLDKLVPADVAATWKLTTSINHPDIQSDGWAQDSPESSAGPSKRRKIALPAPPKSTTPPQPSTSRPSPHEQAAPQSPIAPRPVPAGLATFAGSSANTHAAPGLSVPRGAPLMPGPTGPLLLQPPLAQLGRAHSAGPMPSYLPAPAPIGRAHSTAGYATAPRQVPYNRLAPGGMMGMGGPSMTLRAGAQIAQAAAGLQGGMRGQGGMPAHFAMQPHFGRGVPGIPPYSTYFPQPPAVPQPPIAPRVPSHPLANIAPPRLPPHPTAAHSYPADPTGIARTRSAPAPSSAQPAPAAGSSTNHGGSRKRKNASRETTPALPSAPKRARRSTRLAQHTPDRSGAEYAEAGPSSAAAAPPTTRKRSKRTKRERSPTPVAGPSTAPTRSPSYEEDDDEDTDDDEEVPKEIGPEAYQRLLQHMRERGEEGDIVVRKNDDGKDELAVEKFKEGAYVAFQLDTSHWAKRFPEGSPGRAGMEALQDRMQLHVGLASPMNLLEPCKEGETQLEVQYLATDELPFRKSQQCYLNVKDWFFARNPFAAEAARRTQAGKHAEEDAKIYQRPEKGQHVFTGTLDPWPDYERYFRGTKQYAVLGTKLLVTQYTDAPKDATWNLIKLAMKTMNTRYLHDLDKLRKSNEALRRFEQESKETGSTPCSLDHALATLDPVDEPSDPTDEDEQAANVIFAALRVPEDAVPAKVWRDISAAPAPDPLRFVRELEFVKQWYNYYANPKQCPKPEDLPTPPPSQQ